MSTDELSHGEKTKRFGQMDALMNALRGYEQPFYVSNVVIRNPVTGEVVARGTGGTFIDGKLVVHNVIEASDADK